MGVSHDEYNRKMNNIILGEDISIFREWKRVRQISLSFFLSFSSLLNALEELVYCICSRNSRSSERRSSDWSVDLMREKRDVLSLSLSLSFSVYFFFLLFTFFFFFVATGHNTQQTLTHTHTTNTYPNTQHNKHTTKTQQKHNKNKNNTTQHTTPQHQPPTRDSFSLPLSLLALFVILSFFFSFGGFGIKDRIIIIGGLGDLGLGLSCFHFRFYV